MALKKIILNGTAYQLGEVSTCIYDGVEISENWSDIQVAAENGTTSELNSGRGLRVGDYKTESVEVMEVDSLVSYETLYAQVAGIDTYYRNSSSAQGHHIDFIGRDISGYLAWEPDKTNNGSSSSTSPFASSQLYNHLNNEIYLYLSSDLRKVIQSKKSYAETRYSSSGTISDSTGNTWVSMPYLWLPTEYEVFGSTIYGTQIYSARDAVQYPIFANSWYHRVKTAPGGTTRLFWWTATPMTGSSTKVVGVGSTGTVGNASITSLYYFPLCFRVG